MRARSCRFLATLVCIALPLRELGLLHEDSADLATKLRSVERMRIVALRATQVDATRLAPKHCLTLRSGCGTH